MRTSSIPAAQYLRMSTENQQYSLVNQAEAIAKYAESNGFVIVKSYEDPGRSGLVLRERPGLRALLSDVVTPGFGYKAILVYDISREAERKSDNRPSDFDPQFNPQISPSYMICAYLGSLRAVVSC